MPVRDPDPWSEGGRPSPLATDIVKTILSPHFRFYTPPPRYTAHTSIRMYRCRVINLVNTARPLPDTKMGPQRLAACCPAPPCAPLECTHRVRRARAPASHSVTARHLRRHVYAVRSGEWSSEEVDDDVGEMCEGAEVPPHAAEAEAGLVGEVPDEGRGK